MPQYRLNTGAAPTQIFAGDCDGKTIAIGIIDQVSGINNVWISPDRAALAAATDRALNQGSIVMQEGFGVQDNLGFFNSFVLFNVKAPLYARYDQSNQAQTFATLSVLIG